MEKQMKKYGVYFLLPTVLAFCIGFIYPVIQGIYLSFCEFRTVSDATFIGLDNYARIFSNEGKEFTSSFWLTLTFAIVSVILINVCGLFLASLLTQKIKGTTFFRTVFFLPNLIGGIVLGYIWQIMINAILSKLSLPLLALNSTAGFWGLIILSCWQQIGYVMIIYIAGLSGIPHSVIEAASIDGASGIKQFFFIKLPMLMSSITICIFITFTNAFKLFDQNLALTNGEPDGKTRLMALSIYRAFYGRAGSEWRGLGQAEAVVFCLIVMIIGIAQLIVLKRGDKNE